MSKYIHVSNPKLPVYLKMRFDTFINILENGFSNNILELRNNKRIRSLFCECICVLCHSRKTHSYEDVKINSDEEFNPDMFKSKRNATRINVKKHS